LKMHETTNPKFNNEVFLFHKSLEISYSAERLLASDEAQR
jgi:hypothetical protein